MRGLQEGYLQLKHLLSITGATNVGTELILYALELSISIDEIREFLHRSQSLGPE
jgi:hypothetical protein